MPAKKLIALAAMLAFLAVVTAPVLAEAQQAYEGKISGDFKGWEGETVYKLISATTISRL
jgi:hypothetical protein